MVADRLQVLEFDKIRQLLAGETLTPAGRELASALLPLGDPQRVSEALTEVGEARRLLEETGRAPLGGTSDLRPLLARLHAEGSLLPAEQLLEVAVCLATAKGCKNYFRRADLAPRLAELAGGLDPLPQLAGLLQESIGSRGELLDGASLGLADLRQQLRAVRERIRRVLERMLHDERLAPAFQELLITERNGRYVLPVRADRRGQVKGFVHDESASGQTLFVEPAATLEANNELRGLLREEQREIERILRRLSALVHRHRETLLANQALLGHLDLRQAAARLSLATGGCAPRLSGDRGFDIRQARHPLLLLGPDGRPRDGVAVPIDLQVGPGVATLIVSGPNTGGKTVALKTVGLLHLMVASGLHVPCHPDSTLRLFRQVLADIGDEQSIEQSLSTFSGHLLRLRGMLACADADSLVLLDEIGTGTDPGEGGALALAVLDELREAGAVTVATTHLNLVKGYALLREGVQNAAVEFDGQTGRPSYRLHYGIPGASGALTIARGLELPERVLARAEAYLGEEQRAGGGIIEELNRLSRELQDDRAAAQAELDAARREREKRRQLLKAFEAERGKLLERARLQADRLLREAETRLRKLFAALPQETDTARQAQLTGELRGLREELRSGAAETVRPQAPREVRVGELVRYVPLGAEGEVVRIDGGQVELDLSGKKLRCRLDDLTAFQPRRFRQARPAARVRSRIEREGFQPRLLLVGARVDDALPQLARFLDDALLHNLREVEVVHGSGEGILRRAVRDYLSGHRGVSAFHAADQSLGGENVTIVELGE